MKNSAKLQKQYNKIWTGTDFDPWKQQIVIDLTDGDQMLIILDREDKEWSLIPGRPWMKMVDIKGLAVINEKIGQLITDGKVSEIFLDYQ